MTSVTKTSQLMLYREIIAVCSQIHTKHINTMCGQKVELYIKIQSVPRSKHSVSVTKTSQLMLDKEIIAVCSQIHTKHTRFFNAKADGTYSNLYDYRGKRVTVAPPASPVPIQPV